MPAPGTRAAGCSASTAGTSSPTGCSGTRPKPSPIPRTVAMGIASARLDEKWRAFGWEVRVIDGHDYAALTHALTAPPPAGKPLFIIANTVKGKGVSFMENVGKWHHGVPSDAELAQAIAELDAAE